MRASQATLKIAHEANARRTPRTTSFISKVGLEDLVMLQSMPSFQGLPSKELIDRKPPLEANASCPALQIHLLFICVPSCTHKSVSVHAEAVRRSVEIDKYVTNCTPPKIGWLIIGQDRGVSALSIGHRECAYLELGGRASLGDP